MGMNSGELGATVATVAAEVTRRIPAVAADVRRRTPEPQGDVRQTRQRTRKQSPEARSGSGRFGCARRVPNSLPIRVVRVFRGLCFGFRDKSACRGFEIVRIAELAEEE